jgi:hypothetical protein
MLTAQKNAYQIKLTQIAAGFKIRLPRQIFVAKFLSDHGNYLCQIFEDARSLPVKALKR